MKKIAPTLIPSLALGREQAVNLRAASTWWTDSCQIKIRLLSDQMMIR